MKVTLVKQMVQAAIKASAVKHQLPLLPLVASTGISRLVCLLGFYIRNTSMVILTRWDCRMNRASVFLLGRSGNLDLVGFEPWSIQSNDFKIDTCRFLARRSALLG